MGRKTATYSPPQSPIGGAAPRKTNWSAVTFGADRCGPQPPPVPAGGGSTFRANMGQGRGCPITLTAPVRAPFPWFPRFQARNQLVQDSNSVIALKTKNDKIGSLSHGAAFHEEIMKIGFVSLLGNSRFPYATLFYVMTSILGILALLAPSQSNEIQGGDGLTLLGPSDSPFPTFFRQQKCRTFGALPHKVSSR